MRLARLNKEAETQAEPTPALFTALGEVCWQLYQIESLEGEK